MASEYNITYHYNCKLTDNYVKLDVIEIYERIGIF